MKKAAIASLAVLALLALGLPPVLGRMTESQVSARVAAIQYTGVWTAQVRSFEQGWFRSRAKIELGVAPQYLGELDGLGAVSGLPLRALLGEPATIAIDFAHGPVAVLDGVHFGLAKMVARLDPDTAGLADLERNLGIPYIFEFRGRTSFTGTLAFDADMPAVDLTTSDARVQFSGALLDGAFARNRIVSNGRLDRFEFSSPSGTFSVRDVHGAIDNEIVSRLVIPGEASISIGGISIFDAARGPAPVFDAANLRFASAVSLDSADARLDVRATYAADSVFVDGTRVADANVGVAFRNIDVAGMESYVRAMQGVAVSPDSRAALGELGPAVDRILRAGPSVALDPLRFRLDDEPFAGRIAIAANTAALPPPGTVDWSTGNPALLLSLFSTTVEVDVSKKLAQELAVLATLQYMNDPTIPPDQLRALAEAQSELILVTLVAQGLLIDTGQGYRSELRLADGTLVVNGNALPFALP